jgi:exopolysaccharide production protein ExoZ
MGVKRDTLQSIQAFRGAAATLVVLFHVTRSSRVLYPEHFMKRAFLFGHSGIDFFFVLSGFVMLYAHYAEAGNVRRAWPFLKARFARVFPTYWVMLAITLLFYFYHPGAGDYAFNWWTSARAFVLYDQLNAAVVPIAWTLSYELAFYLFFTLYLLGGRALFAVAGLTWSLAIAAVWAGLMRVRAPILLSPLILEFFLGCLAATIVVVRRPTVRGYWVAAAAALCLAVGALDSYEIIDGYQNVRNFALPYFLLILAGACYDLGSTRVYPRLLVLLGEASYSIYLVHYLGRNVLFNFLYRHPQIVGTTGMNPALWLVVGVLLAAGVAFYWTVERPLLAFSRRALGIGGQRTGWAASGGASREAARAQEVGGAGAGSDSRRRYSRR